VLVYGLAFTGEKQPRKAIDGLFRNKRASRCRASLAVSEAYCAKRRHASQCPDPFALFPPSGIMLPPLASFQPQCPTKQARVRFTTATRNGFYVTLRT
jgi:hypothetical protein